MPDVDVAIFPLGWGAGYTVFGSGMSKSGIAAAQAGGIGVFKQASIYEPLAVPFSVDQFDAIGCIEVIEHLDSSKTFATRAKEVFKAGGGH